MQTIQSENAIVQELTFDAPVSVVTLLEDRAAIQKKEQDHLTKWNIVTKTVRLYLSNIGAESRIIKTTEWLPVSELEQVKIEVIAAQTTEGVQPDENGFCTWNFSLSPYSQLAASLVYKISLAPEVKGIS
ncbi:hypothetical protein ACE1CI_03695 [Aerosakkonemataceae cyanobacterium BLCC-F50]|uniref:DUF4139 domain-containing protein n=1 Tax=Floridaenema flaviceps BLCC-F50 TaxID=3153642 RepID=A0ABV4XKT3_9CYAN